MTSPGSSRTCDRDVAALLADYQLQNTRGRYEALAERTKKECEELLRHYSIKGVVQDRVKDYKSLETKLKGMQHDPDFIAWVLKEKDIYKHHEMGDLAGVRIGVYLPEDVVKVAKMIENNFTIVHLFGTVAGGRDTTQDRNLDLQKHGHGPWHSKDVRGDDEYWEHSGYKSWQMVVEWHKPLHDGLQKLRVEIQIGTVVTQAWAEVQHDVIYKRSADILATPTMKRMIDAINGMAITTEIMLRELERSFEYAKKEAEEREHRPFRKGEEFLDWFRSTFVSQMRPDERQRWVCSPRLADDLVRFCSAGPLRPFEVGNTPRSLMSLQPTPTTFKMEIEHKNLLRPRSGTNAQAMDISALLLEALGFTPRVDTMGLGFP